LASILHGFSFSYGKSAIANCLTWGLLSCYGTANCDEEAEDNGINGVKFPFSLLQIRQILSCSFYLPTFYHMASFISFQLPPALPSYTRPKAGTRAYLQRLDLKTTVSTSPFSSPCSSPNLPSTSTVESVSQLGSKRGDTLEEAIVIYDSENERTTGHSDEKLKKMKNDVRGDKKASMWNSLKYVTK
jgi:hypothetical protein